MNTEEEQKAFEAWATERFDLRRTKLGYTDNETYYAWQGWQARAELDGWRDIKDAPKDGSFILATPCFGTSEQPYQIRWQTGKRKSGWVFGATWLTAEPKYYTPLPNPPKQQGE